tara:strand:+ start:764 stop:1264 length:501 start_codon:yes stop_codon:yes gene_type:complete
MGLIAGQGTFEANTSKSEFLVKGTSTVHDWESVINEYTVKGALNDQTINNLHVSVVSKSIKSGKSIMDDKTYEALEAKEYPNIIFKANELTINDGKINGKGILSLVGKEKEVPFTATTKQLGDGQLQVSGQVNLVMSEFGIEPPTAMFGTLTTGDEVTIEYNFYLN